MVGLRARGRVDGDGGGAGGRNSGSAAIYMLGSGIGTLCFRKRTVRVGRKGASAEALMGRVDYVERCQLSWVRRRIQDGA